MLSQITHLLTLLAFATHVVVGCCAHHGHGPSDICCQSGASLQCAEQSDGARRSSAESSCLSSHDGCGHEQPNVARRPPAESCCTPNHNDYGCEQNLPNPSSTVEFSLADTNNTTPCGHSHQCDGGDCIYLSNSSGQSCIALNLFIAPCSQSFRSAWVSKFSSDSGRTAKHRDDAIGYLSRPQCAMCQSWQI